MLKSCSRVRILTPTVKRQVKTVNHGVCEGEFTMETPRRNQNVLVGGTAKRKFRLVYNTPDVSHTCPVESVGHSTLA